MNDRDRIDELEEEVRQLKALIGLEQTLVRQLEIRAAFPGIMRSEVAMLLALLHSDVCSLDKMLLAIARPGHEDEPPSREGIGVRMCRIRKLIKPCGAEIHTLFRQGYYLTLEDRAAIKAAIARAATTGLRALVTGVDYAVLGIAAA